MLKNAKNARDQVGDKDASSSHSNLVQKQTLELEYSHPLKRAKLAATG